MTINQVQLNQIIERLGDYVFALRFNLMRPVLEKNNGKRIFGSYIEPSDADQSIPDIQVAKNAYYQALSELYVDQEIPPVFKEKFCVSGRESQRIDKNHWWGNKLIEKDHVDIKITKIVKKLNDDFNSTKNIEEQANPLAYTGTRYRSYLHDRIVVGAKKSIKGPGNMPQTNFYFVMSVLSDPSLLLLAVLLVPVSCVLFASGAVIPGSIIAAASVGIASCYAAKRLGFFAENKGTEPSVTIKPYMPIGNL